jgi:predicted nucleic acid-binding protein
LSVCTSGGGGNALVVDANAIISTLLRGRSARVFTRLHADFMTTQRTVWEVKRYIPTIAADLQAQGAPASSEADIERDLERLPLRFEHEDSYAYCRGRAKLLIEDRDPDDVDILALTLHLRAPLWTNDRDFEGIGEIDVITTAELLAFLGE